MSYFNLLSTLDYFKRLRSQQPDADPFRLMTMVFACGRLQQEWGALCDAHQLKLYVDPEIEGRLAGTLFRLNEEMGSLSGHPHSDRMAEYLYPEIFKKST